jgi:hypothetical protein
MKNGKLTLKRVFFGTLAVVGGILVAAGLHGLIVESYWFVSRGYPDSFGFVLGAGFFITGILFLSIGTRYINRKQTFLSNVWLGIIGTLGCSLFFLCMTLFAACPDIFLSLSALIILCLGIYIFRMSRKELAKLISNPDKALSANS